MLSREASTRSAALIRIGLPLIIWGRMGDQWLLSADPNPWHQLTGLVLFASTAAMLVGFWSRSAAVVAGVAQLVIFYYWGMILGDDDKVHHHLYLLAVVTLLTALTPCGRSWSWDRWRKPGLERGPVWGLKILALQVSVVYVFGALDKTTVAYLSGMRLEQIYQHYYFGSDFPPPGFGWLPAAFMVSACASVALEYVLAVGLWFGDWRWRKWLMVVGLGFHAMIYVTLPVSTFSVTMALLYLAFLDPDEVHRVIEGH